MQCASIAWLSACVFIITHCLLSRCNAQMGNPEIRNITASAGDDVLLDCEPPNGAAILISWRKDNDLVQTTDAYRDGRIFMDQTEGMLILNAEMWDRGMYSCLIVTPDSQIITHQFWLDIAPPTDSDVETNSAFRCGYSRIRGKVVGGKLSNEGQSPWTALLWNINEGKPFCGGVLLNRRWVVTASHCFSLSGLSKEEFEIRLGEYDIETVSSYERTFRAEQVIKHPNFNEVTYDSDIALIKLQQPVIYSDHIIPLCLPSELRAEELLKAGQRGFVTGWGNTEEAGDFSRYLRRVRLTIASFQDCGSSHTEIITNNMFCADAGRKSDNRDACQGDSGGPFVTKDNNRWYLIGIVSWGIGCARPGYPGVYTRVQRFRQWIMDLVQQDMQTCEESSFELGEDFRASVKESNNLRLLNQEQQRQIEDLQREVDRKNEDIFNLYERIETLNCPVTTTVTTSTSESPLSTTTSMMTDYPVITERRPLTTRAPMEEDAVACRHNMCWHVSSMARCHGGYCICESPGFSRVSCLPIVGSCRIYRNNSYALATATFRDDSRISDTYACEGNPESNVHIISVYEGPVHTRPASPGDVRVRVTGGDQGPLTLVFSSYEPVRWLVSVDEGIVVTKFVLTGYYLDLSSVELVSLSQTNVTVVTVSRVPLGYGSDADTAEFIKYVQNTYGDIGSFSGTYRADRWVLTVPGETPIVDSMNLPLPIMPMARVHATLSRTSWTPFAFRYDPSFCACHGDQYVKLLDGTGIERDYGVRYVGVVLCQTPNHYKIFLANDLQETFLNVGDGSGGGSDHCEFVGGVPENETMVETSRDWLLMPYVSGYYRSVWGEPVSFGPIGGGYHTWTGKIIVSWYGCGIAIP